MTAKVGLCRDEWWPWIDLDPANYSGEVTLEVSDATLARWRDGLNAATALQSELYAAWVNSGGQP